MGEGGIDDMLVFKEDSFGHSLRIRLLNSADMGTLVVRGCV